MRRRGGAAALLVAVFVADLSWSAASCSSGNCTECAKSECNSASGCFDASPAEYDPAYCIPSRIGGGGQQLDDNCRSALMGLFGGIVSCLFPCFWGCRRRGKQHARSWMSGQPTTRRAMAKVMKKWVLTANLHGKTPTAYYLSVEFTATSVSKKRLKVCSDGLVYQRTYDKAKEGAENLEVIYKVVDASTFDFTEDLECRLADMTRITRIVSAVLGILALAGAGLAIASAPLTGNFSGIGLFVFMAVAAPVLGYALFPVVQKLNRPWVTVTPEVSDAVTIGSSA